MDTKVVEARYEKLCHAQVSPLNYVAVQLLEILGIPLPTQEQIDQLEQLLTLYKLAILDPFERRDV